MRININLIRGRSYYTRWIWSFCMRCGEIIVADHSAPKFCSCLS